jgi:FkbM family methyltransferase
MSRIARLKDFVKANPMELDVAMQEVYTGLTQGTSGFAMFEGGAHKGWHAWRMIQLPGCGAVYAVEADPTMSRTLTDNLTAWHKTATPHLTIVAKALQNRPDVSDIPWMSSDSHVGRSSIRAEATGVASIWDDHKDVHYREPVRVPATTIDAILAAEMRPIPFIKLDLEGADIIALMGGEKTLQTRRPVIAFENASKAPGVHGYTLDDVIAFFSRLGYWPLDYVGDRLKPETWFEFHEAWAVPIETAAKAHPLITAAMQRRIGA